MSFGTDANNTRTTCIPTIIVQFPRISGIIIVGAISKSTKQSPSQPSILYRLKIMNGEKY